MTLREVRQFEFEGERYEVTGTPPFRAGVFEGFWKIVDTNGEPSVRRLNGALGMAGNRDAASRVRRLTAELNALLTSAQAETPVLDILPGVMESARQGMLDALRRK